MSERSEQDPVHAGADDGATRTRHGHAPAEESSPEGAGRRGGAHGGEQGHSIGHSLLLFLKEVVIVVVLAVVLSLILKTWFVQSFWIPSGSMNNTLVKDDRVSVSKLTPRFFALSRGDVVVFEDPGGWLTDVQPPQQGPVAERINSALSWIGLLPNDEGNHLIKRVIGLPGDHVQCCTADGRLLVNGTPITEPYVYPGDAPSERTFDIHVPADSVWVMGDHRSNSRDSRYNDEPSDNGSHGSVPIDKVVGRAFAVVWPLSKLAWLSTPDNTFALVPAAGSSPTSVPSASGSGGASTASPTRPARPTSAPTAAATPAPVAR